MVSDSSRGDGDIDSVLEWVCVAAAVSSAPINAFNKCDKYKTVYG